MTKAFFDAFPTVMPEDEELSSLLEYTTVTKVAVSEKRAQLRIYLDADRLIGKKDLEKVEKTFDEEFAYGQGLKTKIIEHFHLSGQYTPKNLMPTVLPSCMSCRATRNASTRCFAAPIFIFQMRRPALSRWRTIWCPAPMHRS